MAAAREVSYKLVERAVNEPTDAAWPMEPQFAERTAYELSFAEFA